MPFTIPEKRFFHPTEVPEHIPISRRTVYRLIEEGKIHPVERLNHKILIPRDSLVTFLTSQEE